MPYDEARAGAVPAAVKQDEMFTVNKEQQPMVMAVCAVLIGCTLFYLFHKIHQPTTALEINASVERIIGEVAANEITNLIHDRGKVALIGLDPSGRFQRAARLQEAFLKALKKHPNVTVVATELVNPRDVMKMGHRAFGVRPEIFARVLETQPGLDAIVSFAGVPQVTPAEMQNAAARLPKYVAVYAMGFEGTWEKRLLQAGLVQAAIVPNPNPIPDLGNQRRSPEEWYKVIYTVARPDTADLIPD